MATSTFSASHAHFREHEVRLLVEMMRLSRVTLLIAERDSAKSAVLQSAVMPLLGEAKPGAQSEIAVFFDGWDLDPLPRLRSRLEALVPASAGAVAPSSGDTLAESLKAWQASLGATFLFIFDRFEEDPRAPAGRRGYAEFEESLVQVATDPALRANFLLALDEDTEPLLGRLRERIPRLGYSRVRPPRAAMAGAAQPAAVSPAREAPATPTLRSPEPPRQDSVPTVSLFHRAHRASHPHSAGPCVRGSAQNGFCNRRGGGRIAEAAGVQSCRDRWPPGAFRSRACLRSGCIACVVRTF